MRRKRNPVVDQIITINQQGMDEEPPSWDSMPKGNTTLYKSRADNVFDDDDSQGVSSESDQSNDGVVHNKITILKSQNDMLK